MSTIVLHGTMVQRYHHKPSEVHFTGMPSYQRPSVYNSTTQHYGAKISPQILQCSSHWKCPNPNGRHVHNSTACYCRLLPLPYPYWSIWRLA
jgi:hypothetical protein